MVFSCTVFFFEPFAVYLLCDTDVLTKLILVWCLSLGSFIVSGDFWRDFDGCIPDWYFG